MALRSARHLSLFNPKTFSGTIHVAAVALFVLMLSLAARAQGTTHTFTGTTVVGTPAAVVNVPVTFTVAGEIASIRVLTTGIANLDYTDTGAGSCTGSSASWSAGQSCTVSAQFKPTAPGARCAVR